MRLWRGRRGVDGLLYRWEADRMSSSHPNPMGETLDLMRKMIDTITLSRNQAEQRAAEYAITIQDQRRYIKELEQQVTELNNELPW